MSNEPENQRNQGTTGPQPIFLIPGVILALLGLMLAVHLARTLALKEDGDLQLTLWFAFIPIRLTQAEQFPGGAWPTLWTPVTHVFLHAGWDHLLLNMAWLAIFGTPVARRYGWVATLVLFFLSAIAGAALFAATTIGSAQLLIGASGGIAGLTGVACRFIFQPVMTAKHPETGATLVLGRKKMATLRDLFSNRRSLFFIIVWVAINAAVPIIPGLLGDPGVIAWQAHLGGFFAGLLLTPLFDRQPKEHVA